MAPIIWQMICRSPHSAVRLYMQASCVGLCRPFHEICRTRQSCRAPARRAPKVTMGTRSWTRFYKRPDRTAQSARKLFAVLYKLYDGYPEGVGRSLMDCIKALSLLRTLFKRIYNSCQLSKGCSTFLKSGPFLTSPAPVLGRSSAYMMLKRLRSGSCCQHPTRRHMGGRASVGGSEGHCR